MANGKSGLCFPENPNATTQCLCVYDHTCVCVCVPCLKIAYLNEIKLNELKASGDFSSPEEKRENAPDETKTRKTPSGVAYRRNTMVG